MQELSIPIKIYETELKSLKKEDLELVNKSIEAKELSYSPYSKFKVGVAIQLDNNSIVLAANQENAAYPVCLCAERNGLAAVSSIYPKNSIVKLSIAVNTDMPASPCGTCRQSLAEYEKRMNTKFEYWLVGEKTVYYFKGINNLLPLVFNSDSLK